MSEFLTGWESICCFAEFDYCSFRNRYELIGCCDVTGRSTALAAIAGRQLEAESWKSATVMT